MGKSWENGGLMGLYGIYPLANWEKLGKITMCHGKITTNTEMFHHAINGKTWENSLFRFRWPCSIAKTASHYQRVVKVVFVSLPTQHQIHKSSTKHTQIIH